MACATSCSISTRNFDSVINQEVLAGLAPYRLEHINRFGDYVLDFRRKAEALDEGFRILEVESGKPTE